MTQFFNTCNGTVGNFVTTSNSEGPQQFYTVTANRATYVANGVVGPSCIAVPNNNACSLMMAPTATSIAYINGYIHFKVVDSLTIGNYGYIISDLTTTERIRIVPTSSTTFTLDFYAGGYTQIGSATYDINTWYRLDFSMPKAPGVTGRLWTSMAGSKTSNGSLTYTSWNSLNNQGSLSLGGGTISAGYTIHFDEVYANYGTSVVAATAMLWSWYGHTYNFDYPGGNGLPLTNVSPADGMMYFVGTAGNPGYSNNTIHSGYTSLGVTTNGSNAIYAQAIAARNSDVAYENGFVHFYINQYFNTSNYVDLMFFNGSDNFAITLNARLSITQGVVTLQNYGTNYYLGASGLTTNLANAYVFNANTWYRLDYSIPYNGNLPIKLALYASGGTNALASGNVNRASGTSGLAPGYVNKTSLTSSNTYYIDTAATSGQSQSVFPYYFQLASVQKNQTVLYNALTAAQKNNSVIYNSLTGITKSNSIIYNVNLVVTDNAGLLYNTRASVQFDRVLLYNTRVSFETSTVVKYNDFASLNKESTLYYNLFKELDKENSLVFNTLVKSQSDKTIQYNVLQALGTQVTIVYNIETGKSYVVWNGTTWVNANKFKVWNGNDWVGFEKLAIFQDNSWVTGRIQ